MKQCCRSSWSRMDTFSWRHLRRWSSWIQLGIPLIGFQEGIRSLLIGLFGGRSLLETMDMKFRRLLLRSLEGFRFLCMFLERWFQQWVDQQFLLVQLRVKFLSRWRPCILMHQFFYLLMRLNRVEEPNISIQQLCECQLCYSFLNPFLGWPYSSLMRCRVNRMRNSYLGGLKDPWKCRVYRLRWNCKQVQWFQTFEKHRKMLLIHWWLLRIPLLQWYLRSEQRLN